MPRLNSPVPLVCPICSEALLPSANSYACQGRHNYDLSSEGYLSLLHGRGNYQQIGDDKAMVQARVRVHGLPPYAELARSMAALCPQAGPGLSILDIGCGDGFFLDQVSRAADIARPGVGIDVSKGALAKAARSFPGLFFVRSDAAHQRLPFPDSSFGLALSVFAPRPVGEVQRVLDGDGCWLVVTANQDHLQELRQFLPLAAIGTGKLDAPTSSSFSILKSGTSRHELHLGRPDLASIVEMSPSIHRLRREHGDKWSELVPEALKVTFSFGLTLLGKAGR